MRATESEPGARWACPRFKSRRRAGPSCRFTTGTIRVQPDRHHVTLPRLGSIKTHESTRKLARRVEAGTAPYPVGERPVLRGPLVGVVDLRSPAYPAEAR